MQLLSISLDGHYIDRLIHEVLVKGYSLPFVSVIPHALVFPFATLTIVSAAVSWWSASHDYLTVVQHPLVTLEFALFCFS